MSMKKIVCTVFLWTPLFAKVGAEMKHLCRHDSYNIYFPVDVSLNE